MEAWENFLSHQEQELGIEPVNKWLRSLKIIRFDARNLYLEAHDSFQISWFEEHVRKKIQTLFLNNNNHPIKVHVALAGSEISLTPVKNKRNATKTKEKEDGISPSKFTIAFDTLDPYAIFEHFIESEKTPLAYRLLCQLTGFTPAKDGQQHATLATFNPIYLYGIDGTGKTHLLMATAHMLRAQGYSVAYARAETFTEHVVTAIRAGEMSLFRQSYRNADVLIVDDVHLFANKWATQEELFHTFNTLHTAGKQIILSADCSPSELQNVEPRLVSRFEWGIVLPLELLKHEELSRMLHTKAAALNFQVNQKIIDFLLETFTSSPKALSRSLEALVLRTHMHETGMHLSPTQLTIPFVQHQLSDLIHEEQQNVLSPEIVVQQTAEFFGIRSEDILGKTQTRDCTLPRQIAMYICRNQLKMPYAKIGHFFSRDHSTAMSSIKMIQKGIDINDLDIGASLHSILKNLRGKTQETRTLTI